MKNITILLLSLLLSLTYVQAQETGDIPIDEAHFSDATFRYYLTNHVDQNQDGLLSVEERAAVTEMYPYGSAFLNGLHFFPNLRHLESSLLDSIDLARCSSLRFLLCSSSKLLHIKSLSNCSQLDTLDIRGNLPEADWQLPSSLTHIRISSDSLQSFDFDFHLPNLKYLYLNAPISHFNISSASDIQTIHLVKCQLTDLNLNDITSLKYLDIGNYLYDTISTLRRISTHNCHNLLTLSLWGAYFPELESIDLSGCNSLHRLSAGVGEILINAPLLTDLNLSGCQKLSSLRLKSDKLNELDLSDCSNLSAINISAPITALKLPQQSLLNKIEFHNTKLNTLNLSEQPYLTTLSLENDRSIQQIDLSNCPNLETVNCGASFEYYWTKEACENGISNPSWDIIVKQFSGFGCPALEKLDISGCSRLKTLNCHQTGLHTLDLRGTALTDLDCSNNRLQQLILSGLYDLETLDCSNNQISSIDLNDFWKLSTANLSNNRLAFINVKPNINSNPLEINPRCSSDDPGAPTYFEIPLADSNFHPVRLNAQHAFNLDLLPGFDISKMRRIEGGVLNGKMLTFLQDTVRYEYRCTDNGLSAFFALVNDPNAPDNPDDPDEPDEPDEPATGVQPTDSPANLFSVHPVPFHNTLHIETALNLQSVCLYNMQGRLCARFEHGFDALPTAKLEPGLYLILLETADGTTYRLKAIKE